MMPTTTQEIRELAFQLHELGFCVYPPTADGTKRPDGKWQEHQERCCTEAELDRWYANGCTGIGLMGGAVSGNLELFEFEGLAVREGLWHAYKEAADQLGLTPLLTRVCNGWGDQSPSGGIHIYWRCEEPVDGNTELASRPPTAEELRANPKEKVKLLIETRGQGGYMVIAPSTGIHPLGDYVRLRGGPETVPVVTAAERAALLDLARSFDQMPKETAEPPRSNWSAEVVRPGDDFNERGRWEDVLKGWTRLFKSGRNEYWRRPGKTGRAWSATILDGVGPLYVHTTNSELDSLRAYSKFAAYTVLEHGGDWSAAAQELRRQGYGEPVAEIRHGSSNGSRPAAPEPSDTVPCLPSGNRNATDTTPTLPADLWESREVLRIVRQAAHSRGCSADATLAALLARVAAAVPHQLTIPPIVGAPAPLSQLVSLIGPPGCGKSSSNRVAVDLMPLDANAVRDQLPVGSGEGIVDCLFEYVADDDEKGKKVKRQTRYNASLFIDEGEVLTAIGNRTGATLLGTLRTIWSGGTLGQTNASVDSWRVVPAGRHTYGVVVAFQPTVAADLLAGAPAGTPQRFLWTSAVDPSIPDDPPEWPDVNLAERLTHVERLLAGRLDGAHRFFKVEQEIRDEIWARHLAVRRGQLVEDAMRVHRDLLKLKVAACLAILERELLVIDFSDWQLAEAIVDTSDQILAHVQDQVAAAQEQAEKAAAERYARRVVHANTADENRHVEEAAKRIAELARKEPGILVTGLRRRLARTHREVLEDAIGFAVSKGWIHERKEPGQGDGRRAVYPGSNGQ